MPHISEMKPSRFLTKTDVGNGILVRIAGCYQENVAMTGAEEELKWCLTFDGDHKPLVLNQTNAGLIAEALHEENTDNWLGKEIVLYTDPNVMMGGKRVGGIRARARKPVTAAKIPTRKVREVAPDAPELPEDQSDVPF